MGKLGALTILVALAAMIYFFSPGSQVQVAEEQQAIEQPQPNTVKNEQAEQAQLKSSQSQSTNSIMPHSDHQNHDVNDKVEIPQYIQDSLEAKRIPASELVEQHHPDGSMSIDLKGQFQHVPVAVIGQDGKVKIVEAQIQPLTE